MSSSAFRPYGLIKSPIEEALYHRAHIANVYTGIADPKEHETSALMEVILYNNVFTVRDNFIVNSQLPPATQSEKRCDIVIRYLENGTQKIRVLCFAECKRTRTSQTFSLKALEKQAMEYCRLCLESEEDMQFVYAATMAGAHIRLWKCLSDQAEWVPFWGPNNGGDWSQYKDVGDDEAARTIESCFGQMKQFPPTPHAGQSSHTYGASSAVASSAPDYQASTSSYQASASSYQAPTPSYQVPTSSYQAPASSYQVPTSSYQASASSYQVPASSYQVPTSSYQASASSYQVPAPSYQTSLYTISPSLPASQLGEGVPTGGQDQPMGEGVDDDEDDNDDQMEGEVGAQQAATSSAGSDYHIVRVTRKAHRFGKDEFTFKDKKGRLRSTTRDDWRRITYNGQFAWRHHNYTCLEDIFH